MPDLTPLSRVTYINWYRTFASDPDELGYLPNVNAHPSCGRNRCDPPHAKHICRLLLRKLPHPRPMGNEHVRSIDLTELLQNDAVLCRVSHEAQLWQFLCEVNEPAPSGKLFQGLAYLKSRISRGGNSHLKFNYKKRGALREFEINKSQEPSKWQRFSLGHFKCPKIKYGKPRTR